MKKFFLHILLFCAFILLFNAVYILVVGGNLRNYQAQYLDMPREFILLVLGDSHAARAWAANRDRLFYNFAYGSDNISDMISKFDYAARYNMELSKNKTVILPFDGHLISIYRETKQNNELNRRLNNPYLNKHLVYNLPLIFDPNTGLDLKRFILNNVRNRAKTSPEEGREEKSFNKNIMVNRLNLQFPSSDMSAKLISQYQKLIDKIREKHYEIIGIQYPLHPYYDSLVKSNSHAVKLNKVMDSIANHNRIPLIDFSDHIKEEKYFRDQDHLNMAGSSRFVNIFDSLFYNNLQPK